MAGSISAGWVSALSCTPRGLPAGRSARLIVTMGLPALIYRWCCRAHGTRGLERSILGFTGMAPVREILLGWSLRRVMPNDRVASTG